jgi:hypothetical protein
VHAEKNRESLARITKFGEIIFEPLGEKRLPANLESVAQPANGEDLPIDAEAGIARMQRAVFEVGKRTGAVR